jgi:hypothetical protein
MSDDPSDLYELLMKIRYDATAIQAKVTDALTMLGRLNLPAPKQRPACPVCGIVPPGGVSVREHLENVHGAGELDGPPLPQLRMTDEERAEATAKLEAELDKHYPELPRSESLRGRDLVEQHYERTLEQTDSWSEASGVPLEDGAA